MILATETIEYNINQIMMLVKETVKYNEYGEQWSVMSNGV